MILVIMVDRNYFGSFLYAAASLFTTASFSRCFFFSLLLFSRSSGVGNSSEDSLGSRRGRLEIGDRNTCPHHYRPSPLTIGAAVFRGLRRLATRASTGIMSRSASKVKVTVQYCGG